MTKFVAEKTVDLSFIGDSWKDCYVKINSLTLGELEKLSSMGENNPKAGEYMVKLIEEKFLSGKGFDGEKVVDIQKSDVKELPIEIIQGVFTKLTSDLSKKK